MIISDVDDCDPTVFSYGIFRPNICHLLEYGTASCSKTWRGEILTGFRKGDFSFDIYGFSGMTSLDQSPCKYPVKTCFSGTRR